jgi:hypothetical protein
MSYLEDHGLPLVQLKEQRRELVVALSKRDGPISNYEIQRLGSLQQAITAMEAIVDDIDPPCELILFRKRANAPSHIAGDNVMRPMKLVFGRRRSPNPVHQHH